MLGPNLDADELRGARVVDALKAPRNCRARPHLPVSIDSRSMRYDGLPPTRTDLPCPYRSCWQLDKMACLCTCEMAVSVHCPARRSNSCLYTYEMAGPSRTRPPDAITETAGPSAAPTMTWRTRRLVPDPKYQVFNCFSCPYLFVVLHDDLSLQPRCGRRAWPRQKHPC